MKIYVVTYMWLLLLIKQVNLLWAFYKDYLNTQDIFERAIKKHILLDYGPESTKINRSFA